MSKMFNVFWFGRNTGQVQSANTPTEAVKLACEHPSTGAIDKTTGKCNTPIAVVELKGKDLANAEKGVWVRTRADGSTNTNSGDYAFRPHLKNLAKGRDF